MGMLRHHLRPSLGNLAILLVLSIGILPIRTAPVPGPAPPKENPALDSGGAATNPQSAPGSPSVPALTAPLQYAGADDLQDTQWLQDFNFNEYTLPQDSETEAGVGGKRRMPDGSTDESSGAGSPREIDDSQIDPSLLEGAEPDHLAQSRAEQRRQGKQKASSERQQERQQTQQPEAGAQQHQHDEQDEIVQQTNPRATKRVYSRRVNGERSFWYGPCSQEGSCDCNTGVLKNCLANATRSQLRKMEETYPKMSREDVCRNGANCRCVEEVPTKAEQRRQAGKQRVPSQRQQERQQRQQLKAGARQHQDGEKVESGRQPGLLRTEVVCSDKGHKTWYHHCHKEGSCNCKTGELQNCLANANSHLQDRMKREFSNLSGSEICANEAGCRCEFPTKAVVEYPGVRRISPICPRGMGTKNCRDSCDCWTGEMDLCLSSFPSYLEKLGLDVKSGESNTFCRDQGCYCEGILPPPELSKEQRDELQRTLLQVDRESIVMDEPAKYPEWQTRRVIVKAKEEDRATIIQHPNFQGTKEEALQVPLASRALCMVSDGTTFDKRVGRAIQIACGDTCHCKKGKMEGCDPPAIQSLDLMDVVKKTAQGKDAETLCKEFAECKCPGASFMTMDPTEIPFEKKLEGLARSARPSDDDSICVGQLANICTGCLCAGPQLINCGSSGGMRTWLDALTKQDPEKKYNTNSINYKSVSDSFCVSSQTPDRAGTYSTNKTRQPRGWKGEGGGCMCESRGGKMAKAKGTSQGDRSGTQEENLGDQDPGEPSSSRQQLGQDDVHIPGTEPLPAPLNFGGNEPSPPKLYGENDELLYRPG